MKTAVMKASKMVKGFVLAYLFLPLLTFAAQGQNSGGIFGQNQGGISGQNSGLTEFQNPLGVDTLQEFLVKFLEILIQIAFPFIVLAVIYTGFLFVKAQGNPEELKVAKNAFLWTVIGALLILGALAVSELIKATVDQVIR